MRRATLLRGAAGAAALLLSTGVTTTTPLADAAKPRPESIYRLHITINTTSTSHALFVQDPADLVTAKVGDKQPAAAGAGTGSFGSGPLSVARPSSARRAVTRYVLALTPGNSASVGLMSVKGSRGASQITVENANGSGTSKIASFSHKKKHGDRRLLQLPLGKVTAGGPVEGSEPLSPRVFAFYYPWYLESYWYGRAIAPYNRNERPYDSGDPVAIQRHIRQASGAGIEGFISSWFGPGTMTDDNLKVVFQEAPPGLEVGIYFETLSEEFTTKKKVLDAFRYLLTNYATQPQYPTYRGKPLVLIYQPQFILRPEGGAPNPRYRDVWRSIFKTLRSEGHDVATNASSSNPQDLRVFDGLHLYGTVDNPNR